MYIDMVFGFYGGFYTHLYCLVGCLRMIVWTKAVWGVLDACVLYLHLFRAVEHVSQGNALQKYAHYYCCYYYL